MDIKNAAKTVIEEVKKLKETVSHWHVKRQEVFNDLTSSWQAEHQKASDELTRNPETPKGDEGWKEFDIFHKKAITASVRKLLEINHEYAPKTKSVARHLGELSQPYLATVKTPEFGIGPRAHTAIENELNELIVQEFLKKIAPPNKDSSSMPKKAL